MLTEVHTKYTIVGNCSTMVTSRSCRNFLRMFGLTNTHYVLYVSLVEVVGSILNHLKMPADQIIPIFNATKHLSNSDKKLRSLRKPKKKGLSRDLNCAG